MRERPDPGFAAGLATAGSDTGAGRLLAATISKFTSVLLRPRRRRSSFPVSISVPRGPRTRA